MEDQRIFEVFTNYFIKLKKKSKNLIIFLFKGLGCTVIEMVSFILFQFGKIFLVFFNKIVYWTSSIS